MGSENGVILPHHSYVYCIFAWQGELGDNNLKKNYMAINVWSLMNVTILSQIYI